MGATEVKAVEFLASLPNSEEEELMLVMFHYDLWQKSGAEPGFVDFRGSVKAFGARPMSIEWRLAEPIPASLLKESRKLMGR